MHVFIMCHSFLIQEHGTIKYIVNMWENVCFCNNICYHFAKDNALFISQYTIFVYHNCHEVLYHDISFITIIVASLVRMCGRILLQTYVKSLVNDLFRS